MPRSPRLTRRAVLIGALVTGAASACTSAEEGGSAGSSAAARPIVRTDVSSFWDATRLHTLDVEVPAEDLATMIGTYLESGEKEWITGYVTIDGTRFDQVGLKLKGNSSLRSVSADSDPASLPWRIRLDKFVDHQAFEGAADLVVRSSTTATSLNEAVALDLLAEAGLASELSVATSVTVNGSDPVLRLTLEMLDDAWMEAVLGADGILYKAEAGGDYSYRGEDAASYDGIFDIEGGEEDYAPLITLLAFLDESSDEDFAAQLADHLDIDLFARYLAFEDLVQNTDDIDGPGNNSYLYFDPEEDAFTVVAWDHNLAFGGMGTGGAGGIGGPGGAGPEGTAPREGEMPEGFELPADGEMPEGGMGGPGGTMPSDGGGDAAASDGGGDGAASARQGGGIRGGMGGGNVLASRFTADESFAALVEEQSAALRTDLVDSGRAEEILAARTAVLREQAADLVPGEDIDSEAAQITAVLTTQSDPAASDGGS